MIQSKQITFHINNLAYTINIGNNLEKDLLKYLPSDRNLSTKELLVAYIRMTQEFNTFKDEIESISSRLPKIK